MGGCMRKHKIHKAYPRRYIDFIETFEKVKDLRRYDGLCHHVKEEEFAFLLPLFFSLYERYRDISDFRYMTKVFIMKYSAELELVEQKMRPCVDLVTDEPVSLTLCIRNIFMQIQKPYSTKLYVIRSQLLRHQKQLEKGNGNGAEGGEERAEW